MERVKAYVDGFNLYHGLKTRHGRKYLWLDLQALAVRLLKPSQHLVARMSRVPWNFGDGPVIIRRR